MLQVDIEIFPRRRRAAIPIKGREFGAEAVKSLKATDNTTTLKVRQDLVL